MCASISGVRVYVKALFSPLLPTHPPYLHCYRYFYLNSFYSVARLRPTPPALKCSPYGPPERAGRQSTATRRPRILHQHRRLRPVGAAHRLRAAAQLLLAQTVRGASLRFIRVKSSSVGAQPARLDANGAARHGTGAESAGVNAAANRPDAIGGDGLLRALTRLPPVLGIEERGRG